MYPYIYSGNVRVPDNTYNPVGNWPLTSNLNDISGNGFNLTATTGTEQYSYLTPTLPGIFLDGYTLLKVNSFQASLALTGATSFICMIAHAAYNTIQHIVNYTGDNISETEANNILYSLTLVSAGTAQFANEHGAGTNAVLSLASVWPTGTLTMVGFTRSAPSGGSSTVQVYVDGRPFGSSGSLTTPTGGTDGRLAIGGGFASNTNFYGVMAGAVLYNVELTAAQMRERYNYCMGNQFGYIS